MKTKFRGWNEVAKRLQSIAVDSELNLNSRQQSSVLVLAERLKNNGMIIADEVGMGKTRIAVALAKAVIDSGGRIAFLLPPGLGFQWQAELKLIGIETPPILRSLKQYLQAWNDDNEHGLWYAEPAVLISHAFTHWRLGEESKSWRWALLPELYAQWKKNSDDNDGGRYPHGYHGEKSPKDPLVKTAAKDIFFAVPKKPNTHPCKQRLNSIIAQTNWNAALDADSYSKHSSDGLRIPLQQAVGLGLGAYDLVIIDEAHKSRKEESGLSQLLENVLVPSTQSRRVAMTATPVELDSTQWKQALQRIEVNDKAVDEAITQYAQAVTLVKDSPSVQKNRDRYKGASEAFKTALNPYLLRRDKRTEPSVIEFHKRTRRPLHEYRQEQEILIDSRQLTSAWKQAICAAEALSFTTHLAEKSSAKRLRLTLGNGHGIASLLDEAHLDEKADKQQTEADKTESATKTSSAADKSKDNKRMQRTEWWQQVMTQPLKDAATGEAALYNHPAILAAVDAIEKVCEQGEKVLVFGRFTNPLKALVSLINARAMLQHLNDGQFWPQTAVIANEWPAVKAAYKQLKRPGRLNQKNINTQLAEQYSKLEKQRKDFRDNLLGQIESGLTENKINNRLKVLFAAFKKRITAPGNDDDSALVLLARAIHELIGEREVPANAIELAACFSELVEAASDRDTTRSTEDASLDEVQTASFLDNFIKKLADEYSRYQGGVARLMYGETQPSTRRLLQMAFNRRHGRTKVLVAQSVVGREGLNLHKACRTVILLHAEWNPGVVEQQIGRIDRMGSLWETMLAEAIERNAHPNDLPRINIRPIIFQGTYDEKNWQILQTRWDELRSQLHGIVISSQLAEKYPNGEALADEINQLAPNFYPSKPASLGKVLN